jgi:L-ascorbate 6-phosphate lactonase
VCPLDISKIDRDVWLRTMFPEWGTYLTEEIEDTVVEPGKLVMWWLACTGVWLKTPAGANIAVDFWSQSGLNRTRQSPPYEEIKDSQIVRMTGARRRPTLLRCSPHVIDPFAVKQLDAVFATHIHGDHICPYVAAAAVKNTNAVFIGPKLAGDMWESWGVPAERIVRVKPGDEYRLKDITVTAVESFDRTMLLTPPPTGDLRGTLPPDMDQRAVNYVIKTPGGTVYHSGDSHYSNRFLKHGLDHQIDVCFVSFGEDGPGITDKVNASDTLRIAWSLNAKVLIPLHYDMWAAQNADPHELMLLREFNKHLMKFSLFVWKVGGKFTYPDDKDLGKYQYPKGTENFGEEEPNVFFPSFM